MVIWMALSKSYVSFCVARVFAGLSSSWSQTVPASTIADIFVKQVRGSKISMYAVAVVIAPAVSPIFCALVVQSHSWRVLFWIILGMAGLQLALFFAFVPETLWNEAAPSTHTPVPHPVSDKSADDQVEQPGAMSYNSAPAGGWVGSAWMPWERPGEYLQIFLSPILMVSFVGIPRPSD